MRKSSPATELFEGWGRTGSSAAIRALPRDLPEIEQLLVRQRPADGMPASPGNSGIIARGLGRSYNDAARNAGGLVMDLSAFDSISDPDPSTGEITVGAGATIASVIEKVLPVGWFVPVTPGTRSVTIGGAIAADVHGKNHHGDGSFCSHVTTMLLATPSGTYRTGPADDPELFWATAGGMGLTGIVVEATLRLLPVESAAVTVTTQRFGDLHELMAVMDATDADHRYSVAWVDCANRRHPGRAVLSQGDHASFEQVEQVEQVERAAQSGRSGLFTRGGRSRQAGEAGPALPAVPPSPRATVPRPLPRSVIGAHSIKAFNSAWFMKAPRHPTTRVTAVWGFFYPLDVLGNWNYLYGRSGLVQYQFAVDRHHADIVHQAVDMVVGADVPCALAVLKRFGPANGGLLSFPVEGWTLAMDFPAGLDGLPGLLDRLDILVVESGGRVYLAKDARLPPELLAVMYPRSAELGAVRHRVDPYGVMGSDLSRRLRLDCTEAGARA